MDHMNVSDALHFLKILSSLNVAFKRGTQSMLWLRTQQNKSESFRVTWKTRKTVQKTFIWKAKGRKHSPDNKQLSWFQKTLKMDVINNLKELSKCNITWIFCEGIRGMGGKKTVRYLFCLKKWKSVWTACMAKKRKPENHTFWWSTIPFKQLQSSF